MIVSATREPSSLRLSTGHFEPVQFFFYLMESIVSDLVVGTHGENGAADLHERPLRFGRSDGRDDNGMG